MVAAIIAFVVGCVVGVCLSRMSVKQQIKAKQQEIDTACNDAEKFRTRTKEMQEEIDRLLSEVRKLYSSNKDLDGSHDDMEDELDDAKRELKKLRAQVEQLTVDLNESRAACRAYERELNQRK